MLHYRITDHLSLISILEIEKEPLKCTNSVPDHVAVGPRDGDQHDCHLVGLVQHICYEASEGIEAFKNAENLSWNRHHMLVSEHVIDGYEGDDEKQVDFHEGAEDLKDVQGGDLRLIKPLVLFILNFHHAIIDKSGIIAEGFAVFARFVIHGVRVNSENVARHQ